MTTVDYSPPTYRQPDSRALSAPVTETPQRVAESALAEVEKPLQPFVSDGHRHTWIMIWRVLLASMAATSPGRGPSDRTPERLRGGRRAAQGWYA